MSDEKNKKTDEGLQGNEKIENAVAALQKEPQTHERKRAAHFGGRTTGGWRTVPGTGGYDRGRTDLVDGVYQL